MERLGDDVRRSLRAVGVPDAGVLADVTRMWATAVGPGIAAAAWPSRIGRDETLHVSTESAVWAFELARLEAEIAARLAASLPGVTLPPRIRFAVGPVPAAAAGDAAEAPRPPTPGREDRREAARLAATVEDLRLRDLVRRAAAASLAARRDDRTF
jgi:hypothetical protein